MEEWWAGYAKDQIKSLSRKLDLRLRLARRRQQFQMDPFRCIRIRSNTVVKSLCKIMYDGNEGVYRMLEMIFAQRSGCPLWLVPVVRLSPLNVRNGQ